MTTTYLLVAISCPAPLAPQYGYVNDNGVDFEYDNVVIYSCKDGYRLSGNEHGRCNENGTWGEIPQCVRKYNYNNILN